SGSWRITRRPEASSSSCTTISPVHAQVDGAIRAGAGMARHSNSGRCGARVMASTTARKVSSTERMRCTGTPGRVSPWLGRSRQVRRREARTVGEPALSGRWCGRRPALSGGVVAVDEAEGVDAEALVGGGGEALALENVPEVRAAGGAAHLDPAHAEGGVLEQLDRVVVRRGVERGPAAAGVELGLGGEELRPAAAARVGARL